MTALKPCPWPQCGATGIVLRSADGFYHAGCTMCGATGPSDLVQSKAIAAWNTRALTPAGNTAWLADELEAAAENFRLGIYDKEDVYTVEAAIEALRARALTPAQEAAGELVEALEGLAIAFKSLCEMTGQTFHEHAPSRYQHALAALAKARGEAKG